MNKTILSILKSKKLPIIVCSLLFQQVTSASDSQNSLKADPDIEYSINCDAIAIGQYLDQKDGHCNTYLGELLSITSDIRLTQDFGLNLNLVSDKRCINDKLTEINAAYLYYIFDMLGEVHLGNDKPIDQYIKSIDEDVCENRSISSYFNCPYDSFSKYTIVDDHSALRLMWLSPTFNGFKIGLSYIPNSSICRGISKRYAKNLISLGISYEGGQDNVTYGLSSIGYLGKAYESTLRNIKALACEGVIGYKNIALSGRTIFDGSSLQRLEQNNFDTTYMVDLSYTVRNTKLSIGHIVSHRTSESFETAKAYTASVQHKIGRYNLFTQYKRLYSKNNNGHIITFGISRNFNWGTL